MDFLYKTKTLLQAVVNMPKTHTFLRDTFFPKNETFVTEEVLIDYKKGKRRVAPFVAPRVGGITISRDGFKTERIKAPRVAPQRVMTVDDISARQVGENVFSTKTPAQRQAELLATDLKELGESIDRREELTSAQVLFEGRAVLDGYIDDKLSEKIEQEIDFDFTQVKTLSGADLWSNVDADVYGDLAEWRKEIIKNSGISPDVVILGEEVLPSFLNNVKIKEMFDKLNINLGAITPSIVDDAVTFIGKLPGLGLEIYTYDEYYEDEAGELQPMVPAKKVLMAKTGGGGFAYGAVTQLEKGQFYTYEGRQVPKQWADEQNEAVMLRLTSRPVPKPDDVNSWLVANVL